MGYKNSKNSKLGARKSIQVSAGKAHASDILAEHARREVMAERAVESIAAGLKAAESTGKFPKVY